MSDINRWLIDEASRPHEAKMLQLVGNDPARRHELTGRLLSGIEKPELLMYHVDVLHSQDGHRAYEFLIEYCTNDPSVGIYYGCRGFTKKHYNHEKEILQMRADYQALREELIQKLNRRFLGKDFMHRLLPTDNTDSKTYWLFWIQLQPDEDIRKVALTATILIRDIFSKHLGAVPNTLQTTNNQTIVNHYYEQLLQKCAYAPCYDHSQLFVTIIRHLEEDGILAREDEHLWRFIGTPKHNTKADFARLMSIIFLDYVHPKDLRQDTNLKLIPWTTLRSVFLYKDGNAFKDEIRTQSQNASGPKMAYWREKIAHYLQ